MKTTHRKPAMDTTPPIRPGDQLPDFEAHTLDGRVVRYRDIWQNRLVVLVTLPATEWEGANDYREELSCRVSELTAHETSLLLRRVPTTDGGESSVHSHSLESPIVPVPSVLIADRWGEVRYVGGLEHGHLPTVDAVVEWLRFVQMECPECEGETR